MTTESLADILSELEKSSATPDAPQPAPEPVLEPEPEQKEAKPKVGKAVKVESTPVTSGVVIDKSVPIPAVVQPNARVYPLDEMDVGDSFFLASDNKRALTNRIRSAISQYSRRRDNGRKFVTRCVDGGVRCWRVE